MLAAVVLSSTCFGSAIAQTRSEARQYLNKFCLSKNIYFWKGNYYYQRLTTGAYRITNMRLVRPSSVTSSTSSLRFQCVSNCRYTKSSLSATTGQSFAKIGILTLRSGLDTVQRGKCRRAITRLATANGATNISRDMF